MDPFEKNPKVIEETINNLKLQGFDSIHIPGGTSKNCEYYAGGIVSYYDTETKQFFFVGVPYNSNFYKDGDTNGHNKKAGEIPTETFIRELIEETGLQASKEDIELLFQYPIKDRKDDTKKHWKHFFHLKKFTGNLFTFDGANPIDKETAAPIWIPANLFAKVIFLGNKDAFNKAVEKLSMESTEYAFNLMNIKA